MKDEQLVAAIFLLGGIIAGIFSNYLQIFSAVLVASVIYIFSAFFSFKRIKKDRKLVRESFIIFILIWFLVWITLNSL